MIAFVVAIAESLSPNASVLVTVSPSSILKYLASAAAVVKNDVSSAAYPTTACSVLVITADGSNIVVVTVPVSPVVTNVPVIFGRVTVAFCVGSVIANVVSKPSGVAPSNSILLPVYEVLPSLWKAAFACSTAYATP